MTDISGTSLVRFFERDAFAGELTQYSYGVATAGGERFSAYWPSIAYFCPVCGELWGRAVIEHHFNYQPLVTKEEWRVKMERCVECGDGQFLSDRDMIEFDFISPSLLLREVQVLLERY